jgi:1-acyl-sn-glycerol-3-phosphate acyltransferase
VIRAQKGGLGTWAVQTYLRAKMRSAFRGLWVRGALPDPDAGLLLYANHTSWWDGFVMHALAQAAGWDGYCLMEEKNLKRYRFLTRVGAFSVHPRNVSSTLASLRYARGLLQEEGAAVVVFPEGEIRPFGESPLRLEGGGEVLARAADAVCLPVAIRYAFFEDEKPDVLLEVGAAHPPVPLAAFADKLGACVHSLQAVRRLDGFRRVWAGRPGVAERWDKLRGLGGPGGAA